jgi:hypothetical protein
MKSPDKEYCRPDPYDLNSAHPCMVGFGAGNAEMRIKFPMSNFNEIDRRSWSRRSVALAVRQEARIRFSCGSLARGGDLVMYFRFAHDRCSR